MTIVDVQKGQRRLDELTVSGLQGFGIETRAEQSAAISPLTSMRVASAVKASKAEVVIVHRAKDAVAAVSARKLLDASLPYSIIYMPLTIEDNDARIPDETLDGISTIVVAAPTLADTVCWRDKGDHAPAGISRIPLTVIEPTAPSKNITSLPFATPLKLGWIGPIEESDRLKKTVEACEQIGKDHVELLVYGSGHARDVMPIVKGARHMPDLSVTWFGDDILADKAVTQVHALVRTSTIITPTEIQTLESGIPVLDSIDTESLASAISSLTDSVQYSEASKIARQTYKSQYAPCFHVEQLYKLITSLRPK